MGRWRLGWAGVIVLGAGSLAAAWSLWGGRPAPGWLRNPAERGRELYALHCAACHGSEGQGRARGNATSLNNPDFLALASGAFLEATIARGRRGTEMRAWARDQGGPLPPRDVRALVAFIRRWPADARRRPIPDAAPGEPARGQRLYASACANCHGWTGQGELGMGPAVRNPDLLAAADDAFLWATIAYGRRDTPMFPSLIGLDGVRQLSEQEISDLVAYLRRGG
jgi:cytochrome c oxidase cbb3-type subunit 3